MKKCIVYSDSFKGTISSLEICSIAKKVINEIFPSCQVITIPAADGGEGTVDCFISACGAKPVSVNVPGPLGDETQAVYAVMGDTAVIEMAAAAGLPLIQDRKDPVKASTYGVGIIIRHAIQNGCKKILLGLGGSATNDGGCGMAAALGVIFRNKAGDTFVPSGGNLDEIVSIDISPCREFLKETEIIAMCDVNNPLCGERGASAVYGPQKGATPAMVETLDRNLALLAEKVKEISGTNAKDIPGAGAAGGMGFGTISFLGGTLRSGCEAVLDICGFDQALSGTDLVITGEGKLDGQSLQGKLISGVASRTRKAGVPLVAVVGMIDDSAKDLYSQGLTAVFQTNRAGLPFEQLADRAAADYEATLRDVMHLLKISKKIREV